MTGFVCSVLRFVCCVYPGSSWNMAVFVFGFLVFYLNVKNL